MCRTGIAHLLAVLVFGFLAAAPAAADEKADLERVRELTQQLQELEARQQALLQQQIETYLARTAYEGADGDSGLNGVSIEALFTANHQSTIGLDPFDTHSTAGRVDLLFNFEVTENIDIFVNLNLNVAPVSRFPGNFPLVGGFGGGVGRTFAGLSDGIGVDGLVGITTGGRNSNVTEAGVHHAIKVGDRDLHVEWGALDARTRFHQQSFAEDHRTQFMNNVFTDTSAVLWLTDATGRASLGIHFWMSCGDNNEWTVNTGWFNTTGQFFNNGQWFFQVSFSGDVGGREMNVRAFGFIDEFFVDAVTLDSSAGGGLAWDWMVADRIGVFLTIAANSDTANPIELDATVGAVFQGVFGRRPKDVLGVGLAVLNSNSEHADPAIAGLPQDTEIVVEIYYRYVAEDGRLQITPSVMIVTDPGGNGTGWLDDTLVLFGVRIHVPF